MIGTTGTAIGRSALPLVTLCLLPQNLPAQAPVFNIPPNTILPNYNRVALGQREALEGGAYVARTDDAVIAGRVAMFDFALQHDRHRLESAMRVCTDAARFRRR